MRFRAEWKQPVLLRPRPALPVRGKTTSERSVLTLLKFGGPPRFVRSTARHPLLAAGVEGLAVPGERLAQVVGMAESTAPLASVAAVSEA
jgi:hypothetical protein